MTIMRPQRKGVLEKADARHTGCMESEAIDTPSMRAAPIGNNERSGVLNPANLERYGARWFEPDAAVADVVEHYWHVRWHLDPGEVITQRIIAAPAVTLSIEAGDVPARLVITGVHRRAWQRDITGSGNVLGIRLRPAGLAVLADTPADRIADATVAVTRTFDARLHRLLAGVAAGSTPEGQVAEADRAIRASLSERPVTAEHRLANAVVDELTRQVRSAAGPALAQQFGVSERTIQRALSGTLGLGPKWVTRWIRLQEVARLLSGASAPEVADVAAELGYTDQAHLVNDFRAAVGITPGMYVRSLRDLTRG